MQLVLAATSMESRACHRVGGRVEISEPNTGAAEEGYSPSDIRKIYGGNTLRVMRAVEKVAVELKSTR